MRLAMIGHKDFPSRSGGVEVVVWELATRLARRDCRVAVYNRGRRRGDNHGWAEGVEYFRAPTMGTGGVSAMLCSLTATVQALLHGYDLIHYHALGPSVMLALARLGGVGTVATVHGLDWRRAKWNAFASAYLRLGERVIAKYADEVIVLSRDMQAYFRDVYGRETHLIENGVAPVEYAPCGEIARRWGLEKGSYVLFLARIVPEKGLHYLIRAFRRCKTDRQLVIAGEVPDSRYGREILALAQGCPRIRFTGFAEGRTLRELYSNCALYVLPSEVEGLALSLLEAMSAGARCLTSDIPENADVLGDFGATFASGDEQSLYERLAEALDAPPENPRAEEQMRCIRERYDYALVEERTWQVYQRVLGGAPSERVGEE